MSIDLDKIISVDDAAVIIGVTSARVRQMAQAGRLRSKRVGRDWVIDRDDAEREAGETRKPGRPRG